MAGFKYSLLRGSLNPDNIFKVVDYNRDFRKEHPEFFDPDGIIVFCGPQGSGKTLSAVQYVQKLCAKYPKVMVVSNMSLRLPLGIAQFPWQGSEDFTRYRNGYAGVIFLIEEIHLEFNSLESKKMDSSIFTTVSQQRKQRIHIVGTSQVFNRIAKPFREQFKYVVACRKLFGVFQINTLIDAANAREVDGQLVASSIKSFRWFHSPALYGSYDTYSVINRFRKDWGEINGRSD